MNNTEERLGDALEALASTVHPETLRPLADPARPAAPRAKRYRGWLIPAAAAAAVLLVTGLSLLLAGRPGREPATPHKAPLPRYYVVVRDLNSRMVLESRAVTSGRVVSTYALSTRLGVRNVMEQLATADGHTFFINVLGAGRPDPFFPSIYRFRLTATGQITGFAQVTTIPGDIAAYGRSILPLQSMAMSPDGSKLALALGREVVVVDVRTGARTVWRGGLGSQQDAVQVQQVSWAGDGHTVAILLWRVHPDLGAEVRTVNAGGQGGTLASARLVLRWPTAGSRLIEQAVISPDGTAIVAAIWPGTSARPQSGDEIVQYPISNDRQPQVLYRDSADPLIQVRGDGAGHWLLTGNGKLGWISGGRMHDLPPAQGGTVTDVAW